jgi:hypothetical protein
MPARQSVIGRVVPPEDLSTAIPLNALTFNMARLVGPAIVATMTGLPGCEISTIDMPPEWPIKAYSRPLGDV